MSIHWSAQPSRPDAATAAAAGARPPRAVPRRGTPPAAGPRRVVVLLDAGLNRLPIAEAHLLGHGDLADEGHRYRHMSAAAATVLPTPVSVPVTKRPRNRRPTSLRHGGQPRRRTGRGCSRSSSALTDTRSRAVPAGTRRRSDRAHVEAFRLQTLGRRDRPLVVADHRPARSVTIAGTRPRHRPREHGAQIRGVAPEAARDARGSFPTRSRLAVDRVGDRRRRRRREHERTRALRRGSRSPRPGPATNAPATPSAFPAGVDRERRQSAVDAATPRAGRCRARRRRRRHAPRRR